MHQAGAELSEILAENIRRVAEKKGLPIAHVADRAGVGRSHLFGVLAGDSSPTLEWLAKVAEALEVDAWELLKR